MVSSLHELPGWLHTVFVDRFSVWILIGFVGQIFFTLRFVVQWIASERARRSVVPVAFWFFSLGGGFVLLVYAIQREDPVFIAGQAMGLFIYLRNLWLIGNERKATVKVSERRGVHCQERRGMKNSVVLLFLFSLLLTASGLASLPPLDRDEPRFTQATKQMVETGNYIDIRFQDEARYNKPVGIYWLQAAAVTLSGQGADASIWVYRLVSALGIAIAVAAVAWTGISLFGGGAGIAAGLVLAAIVATAFEGRDAKTDAVLLACCVAAQGALAQIYVASRRKEAAPGHLPWVFWIAQGLGILIKGPLTPLLSATTVLALVAFDREWRWLIGLRTRRGLLIVALIVLPWLALISWKSGVVFWQNSVGKDFLSKAVPGKEPHGQPPGYFALTYSLFMWPFGLIAMGAALQALNHLRDDPRVRFCLAWYIPFWLLFEAIPTKLPHYVMPAYPGLALLIGWVLTLRPDVANAPLRTWQRWLWWATALGSGIVTLGLAGAMIAAPIYLNHALSWWSIPAAAAILAAGYLAFSPAIQVSLRRIGAVAVFAGIGFAIAFGFIAPSLTPIWMTPRIVQAVDLAKPCPGSTVASAPYREPSLIFLLGTATLLTDADGAARHLVEDPACGLALVGSEEDARFRAGLAAAGLAPRQVGRVEGINYSSSDRLVLTLYRTEPRS